MKKPDRYVFPAVFTYTPDEEIAVVFPDLDVATSGTDDADALASARELLGCVLYGLVIGKVLGHAPVYWVLALYGLLGSLVSQMGDLSFSYIKRQYGIKDYGHLFREHGGVLDRFDSVTFCAPLTYLLLMIVPFFEYSTL